MNNYFVGGVFLSEFMGTAILILFGAGVVANVLLNKSKGNGGGWLLINWGWAIGVYAGIFVAFASGAHLNPAVTVGLWVSGSEFYGGNPELGLEPIAANAANALRYFAGQLLGAMAGAALAWLAYKKHFDESHNPSEKLAVFSTGPAIRSYGWNVVTEIIATFVLVFVILHFGPTPTAIGPLAVAFLVLGIGAALGGPTGYAINPARDLGPRIAHAILPIKGKGGSDWAYSWVPIVGPLIGGAAAGLFAHAIGTV